MIVYQKRQLWRRVSRKGWESLHGRRNKGGKAFLKVYELSAGFRTDGLLVNALLEIGDGTAHQSWKVAPAPH